MKTTIILVKRTLTPTMKFPTIPTQTTRIFKKIEDLDLCTYPVRLVVKPTMPEKFYFGANADNRPPPRNRRAEGQNQVQQRSAQNNSDVNVQAAAQTLNLKRHVVTFM